VILAAQAQHVAIVTLRQRFISSLNRSTWAALKNSGGESRSACR